MLPEYTTSPLTVSVRTSLDWTPMRRMLPLTELASTLPVTVSTRTSPLTLSALRFPFICAAWADPDTDSTLTSRTPFATSTSPLTLVASISPCDPLAETSPDTASRMSRDPRGTETSYLASPTSWRPRCRRVPSASSTLRVTLEPFASRRSSPSSMAAEIFTSWRSQPVTRILPEMSDRSTVPPRSSPTVVSIRALPA